MIQKGHKVMHLTGDSVIRQNGEGIVFDVSIGQMIPVAYVIWEDDAFVGPNPTNRQYPVEVERLAVVTRCPPSDKVINNLLTQCCVGKPTGNTRCLMVDPPVFQKEMRDDHGEIWWENQYPTTPHMELIPTNRLRYHERPDTIYPLETITVLQQYWEDNQGNGEWRDVPTENEETTGSFKIEGSGTVVSELRQLIIDGVLYDVVEPKGLPSLIGYEGTVKLERSKKQ